MGNDLPGRKMLKSAILVKIPKKKIINALLRLNLASDHLNKDRILFLRSKTIKKRCSLGILRENLQLRGNGKHRQKCKKYSLFSLKNAENNYSEESYLCSE